MTSNISREETPQIELVNIDSIKPYKSNARKHSKKQIQQIANSIDEFGFINPAIISKDGTIIAGHGRLEALKLLKRTQVPVIRAEHLTDDQIKAYRIADNKLAENSTWDFDLLKVELVELSLIEDFDIEIIGFETEEIDLIIGDIVLSGEESNPLDEIPEPEDDVVVTKLGDIWNLGDHRLFCGDSLDESSYKSLMEEMLATTVVTDPPYNVKINGHVSSSGKHKEFAMGVGELSNEEFPEFISGYMKNCVKFSKDGSLHFHFIDWRSVSSLIQVGNTHYTELKNICVWVKNNGGLGSLYRSQHELVAVFKNGKKPHINNIQLGSYGRYRTNVWEYAGVNSFGKNRKDLDMHPTVKPVALIMDAIKDCSKRGDIVLDPFGGSGSTLIAAEKVGRKARLIELDSKYCDVIIRRWQNLTGKDAVHAESGKTFNELYQSISAEV